MVDMPRTKCRIPCEYIVTSGVGQSSFDAGADHFETGAYDVALLDAGIENFNVVMYTSVLPPQSVQITMKEAHDRKLFEHGAVLETIKAQMQGTQNERLTAGVGRIHVWKSNAGRSGEDPLIGGFAAEYEGNDSEDTAKNILMTDLDMIFHRRYGGNLGMKTGDGYYYEFTGIDTRSFVVDDDYGVCFVALCFMTYIYPVLGTDEE